MPDTTPPKTYQVVKERHPEFLEAVEELARKTREEGPLDEKTAHLIQLAAAVAVRSEGAVHSHAKRAMAAGAHRDEIYHTLILLTTTIGFPTVVAGISWVNDVI